MTSIVPKPIKLISLDAKDIGYAKRPSLYRNSREIKRMQKISGEGGKKMKPCLNDESFLTFELIDTTSCGTTNESVQFSGPKKEPPVPLHMQPKSPSIKDIQSIRTLTTELLDFSFRDLPEERMKISISCSDAALAGNVIGKGEPMLEELKYSDQRFLNTVFDGDIIHEKKATCMLSNSSENVETSGEILKSGHKINFSSFKKMLDPIMKLKHLHMKPRTCRDIPDMANLNKYKTFPTLSLNDFSKEAHFHATLNWELNHGCPSYKFSVKDHEDTVLSAKMWKLENSLVWVYSFHCCEKQRHPPSSSLMIGRMQASCYLCSNISENGSLDIFSVTEFTLYDISQARRSFTGESHHRPSFSDQFSVFTFNGNTVKQQFCEFDSNFSTELQPNLEIASIVTQIPLIEKESLQNKQAMDCNGGHTSLPYVKVAIPSGRHGLPNSEDAGPTSLLDRWRYGGGCDCGGWDLGCPVVLFDNVDNDGISLRTTPQRPLALFAKGKKGNIPALTITSTTGNRQYAIDFHAELSPLQAFSISTAFLHSSQASLSIGEDMSEHNKLLSNSPGVVFEGGHLVEAVAKVKRRTEKRTGEQTLPSFFLGPPFSPMGRV